jgi:hypothetical protein
MPSIALAIAAQLLASQKIHHAAPELTRDPAVLVLRDDTVGTGSAVAVWMPIVADPSAKQLTYSELSRLAESTERVVSSEEPTFIVDNLRAGRPKATGQDGGVAGDSMPVPGLDLGISIFAASSIPPDLQLQLFDAVAAVEHYLENTVHNALIGPGGTPQDVTIRLALRVSALAANLPGASKIRASAVPMSEVTRKLATPSYGDDGDDFLISPVVGPDGDSLEPPVPSYIDGDGDVKGIGSLRVRYAAPSSAVSGENRVFLTRAQYLAFGFGTSATGPTTQQYDGTILMNSGFQWDYDPSDGASLNQVTRFSFQDYLVREILVQLGWISGIDFLRRDLTLLDMFRFSSLAATWEVSTDDSTILVGLALDNPAEFGEALESLGRDPRTAIPQPITSLDGSAWLANGVLRFYCEGGNTPGSIPLDYNPGVSSQLLASEQRLLDAGGPTLVDFGAFANLISNEVTTLLFSGEAPSATDAAHVSLISQLVGLQVPVPQPSASGRPTARDEANRFDDGDWPPSPSQTRYPDGAVPTIVGWPAPPRVQWDFNAPATLAAAGSANVVPTASTPFAGARLNLVGGLSVADCETVSRAPSLLPVSFIPSSDPTRDFNRCLRIFQNWGEGAGIEIACSTTGAAAPSVRLDMMLSESASSTWLFEYSRDGVSFGSEGLPHDGYLTIATADAYQCGIRFDLLIPSFSGSADTRFRLTAVPPQGSTDMQSVSQAAGGSTRFNENSPVEFDMVTVSPTVGAQVLVDFNQDFRGHMPRLVARGARSHLNFALAPDSARHTADTEFLMGTGNSFNNSRASLLSQTTVSIPPWERFLMGQASTSATTTIPRGITYWTRDPAAYAAGPNSPAWQPLGSMPDFLSDEELLILDHLGWDITGATTTGFEPPMAFWRDLVGEQLHTPHPAYDETGSARP